MKKRSKSNRAPGGSSDHFLAALSHELRTPLNGVLGMADLLSRTKLDPAQHAYLEALRESGEHLLGLVNDVLGLAKIESVGFELAPAPVDLERLLQATAELLSPRAHAKGLEIAWCADPGIGRVMADEGRLRQVLLNLAGNAVKFTSRGAVLISAERASEPGRIRLRVEDTGPGISREDQTRIFEPFAQGPASRGGGVESTGLGLAIVSKLAEAFGGEIGLSSKPGKGSCFWFEAAFEPAPPTGPAEAPLAGVTVAVVSSCLLLARSAARQIEACGGKALHYASIAAAKSAPAGAPMLVDYGNGRRARPPEGRPSIVLLTPEQRERIPALRGAGFDGYLIKPLRRLSLATRILAVTGKEAAPAAAAPSQGAPAEDERASAAAAAGARVLLADDNPINVVLARALLEREGCTVDAVKSGHDAVAAAVRGGYDLILLDLRMPGLDGVEAARQMRRHGVKTAIAALTADAFDDTRRACIEAGMDDFLTKPLSPVALRALLARLIRPGFTESRPDAKLAI